LPAYAPASEAASALLDLPWEVLMVLNWGQKVMATTPTFTALIRDDGPWWIGWVEEVPGVNAQEHSREELLDSLRQVLREALEFNRLEALEAAGPGSEKLALSL
jgi:predicted RNase H-like HicB family nuclease